MMARYEPVVTNNLHYPSERMTLNTRDPSIHVVNEKYNSCVTSPSNHHVEQSVWRDEINYAVANGHVRRTFIVHPKDIAILKKTHPRVQVLVGQSYEFIVPLTPNEIYEFREITQNYLSKSSVDPNYEWLVAVHEKDGNHPFKKLFYTITDKLRIHTQVVLPSMVIV